MKYSLNNVFDLDNFKRKIPMNEECFISYLFSIQDLINITIVDINGSSIIDLDGYLNKTINGNLDNVLILEC